MPAPTASIRQPHLGEILLLGSLTAFGAVTIDLYLPTLPAIARDYGTSAAAVQLSLSTFFVGMALGQLFFGPLSDRIGRRPTILIGCAVYVAASLFCALAPTIEALVAGRFFQALGCCAAMVTCRAIVRDPKVYLFDEPLSNLDAALRVATRIEIAQLKESMPDSTMIYVTHDQVEAMTLASRIVVLANKGIAQVGTPLELYERPENEFVAQFIGSPAMNLLAGEIVETGKETVVKLASGGIARSAVPTTAADKGLKVNVGVRPEDLVQVKDQPVFSGKVAYTEALGEVTILYFEPQDQTGQVISKLSGIHADFRGKTVSLGADPAKVQIFHNGRSLYYR